MSARTFTDQQLLDELKQTDGSQVRAAQNLGVSVSAVRQRVLRFRRKGVAFTEPAPAGEREGRVSRRRLEQVLETMKAVPGGSVKEVASELGVAEATVRTYLTEARRQGLLPSHLRKGRLPAAPPLPAVMWGRVLPDQVGRPTYIHLPKDTRAAFEGRAYSVRVHEQTLRLAENPRGMSLIQKGLNLGKYLDLLNMDGGLTNLPFPIDYDDGVFILRVREPDADLATQDARALAMPMQMTGSLEIHRQTLSIEDMARLFALAEIARQEAVEEDELRGGGDDLLRRLPAHNQVLGRFGTWKRFAGFVAFQRARLERQGVGHNEAYERLESLLERDNSA